MKKNRIITLGLVLLALALLVYAIHFEEHEVSLFADNAKEHVGGSEYVNSIESGQLMRSARDGRLYDAKSLKPKAAQIDDCPT